MEYQAKAERALTLANAANYAEAIPLLRELLRFTYVVDFEYDDWLRALADSTKATGQPIAAGYIYLYLHYFDLADACFQTAQSVVDLALCAEVRGDHARAAELYSKADQPIRAAMNLEYADDWTAAVAAWELARDRIDAGSDAYAHALATVNLALALRRSGDVGRTRDLLVEAIIVIEGLADEWEGHGLIDESLGAYHVLCLIGQTQQRFENLAEGYCNAIRLLREQGQTYRVFRYYAALTRFGENLSEDHAVATLHREAADYAVRTGTMYQNFYLNQAAEAYARVAEHTSARGDFPELAENAYLAAIDAYNQMGDVGSVERCYTNLSALALDNDRTVRYRRLAAETSTMPRQRVELYPPSRLLLTPPELPAVWRDDLSEWESGEGAMAVLTNIVWNLEFGDVARRHALNLILYHRDLAGQDASDNPALLKEIAQAMGGLRYTVAYKTLRRLVEDRHASVRTAVMVSAARMGHPKGLSLLEIGLTDASEEVRDAALAGLASHNYPDAYDHLVRIFQDHATPEVQRTVLETLAQCRTFEAAEFLWGSVRSEAHTEGEMALQDVAARALAQVLKPEWRTIFLSRLGAEPEDTRKRLRAALDQGSSPRAAR